MKKIKFFVALFVCLFLNSVPSVAQNAITFWKDGVPTVIYETDSLFFWNVDGSYEGGYDNGEATVLSDDELYIQSLPSDEESCEVTTYSEEDSLRYDAYAQSALALIRDDDDSEAKMSSPSRSGYLDDSAEDAIRNNGINNFDGELAIEQQDWDLGKRGKSRYGGFDVCYNTFTEGGDRMLLVVFYHKGGFPNAKIAHVKSGQLNTGKSLGKIEIPAGREYGFIKVNIDKYIPKDSHGCVNLLPLLITKESEARNYLNPVMVKSTPLVASDWRTKYYGYEFGRIDGVSVYFNNDSEKGNINVGDGDWQCVNLCSRYIMALNTVKRTSGWSHAYQWPTARANDSKDPGRYKVFANGDEQVREGDIFVYDRNPTNPDDYGHVGVVVKVAKNYICVAHQNGGGIKSHYNLPIGTILRVDGKKVLDKRQDSEESPIFGSTHKNLVYFIRMTNALEIEESYSKTLECNTTNLAFGSKDVGSSATKTIILTNKGYSTLTISDIKLSRGTDFSVDKTSLTIPAGESKSINVTFTPTSGGELTDRIGIISDAEDNPTWAIKLSGTGTGSSEPDENLYAETTNNGKHYAIYWYPDRNDIHSNADGTEFCLTSFKVDVAGKTYEIPDEYYIYNNDETNSDWNGISAAYDKSNGTFYFYTFGLVDAGTYAMKGSIYEISKTGSISKYELFTYCNWGWHSYFNYSNDELTWNAFSYAGYYGLEGYKDDGSWVVEPTSSIWPDDFHAEREKHETILIY